MSPAKEPLNPQILKRMNIFFRGLLVYTILVILWGAWVRISKSGDGCGENWPLCQGELIPSLAVNATMIEFGHRLMSGVYGLVVIFAFVWVFRKVKKSLDKNRSYKNLQLRTSVSWLLVLTVTEALLGAFLVLAGLTGENASVERAVVMSLHMLNSLFLVASSVATCLFSSEAGPAKSLKLEFPLNGKKLLQRAKKTYQVGIFFFILVAMFGAMAALSATLYPTESLVEGIQKDFSPESPLLLKLRVYHPVIATTLIGGILIYLITKLSEMGELRKVGAGEVEKGEIELKDDTDLFSKGRRSFMADFVWKKYLQTTIFLSVGLAVGYLNIFLLSPIWLKLTHLLIAHIIWIQLTYVFFTIRSVSSAQFARSE